LPDHPKSFKFNYIGLKDNAMKFLFVSIICFGSLTLGHSQAVQYAATLQTERSKLELSLQQKITQTIALPLNAQNEAAWLEAFWAMELMQVKNKAIEDALFKQVLAHYDQLSLEAQRQSLETIYALYPREFEQAIAQLLPQEKHPKLFAMMVHYLRRNHQGKALQKQANAYLLQNLAQYADHPIVYCLKKDLEQSRSARLAQRPPLHDLLQHPFPGNPWVFFSFQRLNRDYPGQTLIREPNGQFVRDSAGQLFHIPHLARAVSNFPGYITNGNTPQGILSILEITTTDNQFIGPNEMLNMVLPYEVPLLRFNHESSFAANEEAAYRAMLPASWQNYFPIWEAYYAGKAGRTEIFAHGTTINPQFYSGAAYYPNTPSLGCLTASEVWNPQNGQLESSDQLQLIQTMKRLGISHGYFIVVETDDQDKAVSKAEVENWIKN
jgi:hypothetical protein